MVRFFEQSLENRLPFADFRRDVRSVFSGLPALGVSVRLFVSRHGAVGVVRRAAAGVGAVRSLVPRRSSLVRRRTKANGRRENARGARRLCVDTVAVDVRSRAPRTCRRLRRLAFL